MSAETTLLPVARPRPPWLAGLGVFLVLALLIGGAVLVASRSGGGRVATSDPAGPLAAGSRSADPPGSPSGALESPSGVPAASAASSGAQPSPAPRPSASVNGGTAPTTPGRSPSPTRTGAAGLTVAFRQSDSWNDGYQASYTITNHSTVPVSGWTVAVTFSGAGQFQWWDADAKTGTNHQMIFTPKSYNSTVPAGGSVTFGLIVRGSPPPTPTACTVNGHPC
jgi:hypothetical protein